MEQYYVVRKGDDYNELMHYGVLGMKWGVRRSTTTLSNKATKLTTKNSDLYKDMKRYNDAARKYDIRSAKMVNRNSKYEAKINKATAQKAKYDYKQQRALSKPIPNMAKVAKYTRKSAKANSKMLKAQSKLKYNKWDVKSGNMKAAAAKAQEKIDKNQSMINMYTKTIDGINSGTVKQGRMFMQYITD